MSFQPGRILKHFIIYLFAFASLERRDIYPFPFHGS